METQQIGEQQAVEAERDRLVEQTSEAFAEYLRLSNAAELAKARWVALGDEVRALDVAAGVFRGSVRCYRCQVPLAGQPIRRGGHRVGAGSSSGPACEAHADAAESKVESLMATLDASVRAAKEARRKYRLPEAIAQHVAPPHDARRPES